MRIKYIGCFELSVELGFGFGLNSDLDLSNMSPNALNPLRSVNINAQLLLFSVETVREEKHNLK